MYKAQELIRAKTLRMREKDVPSLQDNSVLVKVMAAGICGTDLEYYEHGYCGSFVPNGPLVLGHEFCGIVEQAGRDVTSLSSGDRVAIDPSMPCGVCPYCKDGRYNLCDNMRFFGSASCSPHIDGGFAEYAVVPEKNCFKVADDMRWAEMALVEPFSVALAAVKKIKNITSCDVLVFGAGAIGQLIIKALRYSGAKSIVAVDPRKEVQNHAEENGVDAIYTPENVPGDAGAHVCIDASGSLSAIAQAYEMVAKGGQIIQVGTSSTNQGAGAIPINFIMAKELTIRGSFRYAHVFSLALDMIQKKRISLSNLVSHTVRLDTIDRGFQLLLNPNEYTCKVQICRE